MRFIKKTIEEISGIEDLSLYKRNKEYPLTRYAAFQLSREFLPKQISTFESIAHAYGLKNHSSVLIGVRKFNQYKDQDFYKPYFKRYELAKHVIREKIHGIEGELQIIKTFNKLNKDKDLKSSLVKVMSFMDKFYKTA